MAGKPVMVGQSWIRVAKTVRGPDARNPPTPHPGLAWWLVIVVAAIGLAGLFLLFLP